MIDRLFNNLVKSQGDAYLRCFDVEVPVRIQTLKQNYDEPDVFEGYVLDCLPSPCRTDSFYKAIVEHTDSQIYIPTIKDVIFNNPATIVLWGDGTKTVVKCQDGDEYSEEVGLALCIAKKALGNKPNFNNIFRKWIPEYETDISVEPQINMSEYMTKLGAVSSRASEAIAKFTNALSTKNEKEKDIND